VKVKVKMPKLGQTLDAVVVIEWLCQVGDTVQTDDPLMTVETDKVDADVPSPVTGVVTEQLVGAQDEVTTGTPICVIDATS
jgi:pyruvate dehydrogenase E2 component (dihydrolipoamide acetyltransferase)